MKFRIKGTFLLCAILISYNALASISPNDFGLKTAKNGEERFWALYKAHVSALRTGSVVDYSRVGDIFITIPANASTIPLSTQTDFHGITITVENTTHNFLLFSFINEAHDIYINQDDVDGDCFEKYPALCNGVKLLIVEDKNPWVENRKGYDYGVIRKDIRMIVEGVAQNSNIMPYHDPQTSKPECSFVISDYNEKSIKNLRFIRTESSSFKTFLFEIVGQNNLILQHISIKTPWNTGMYGDQIITVSDCANVKFYDVEIDGTYSKKDHFGYGIGMNNVYNASFDHLKGNANWGIFGNNNINVCNLENCEINRFDIHCYGRDVTLKACTLRDMMGQFSSTFGSISYENCNFINYLPYLTETSFNCYVPFTLVIKDCKMQITSDDPLKNVVCYMGRLNAQVNQRPELNKKSWPNIIIDGFTIENKAGHDDIFLFYIEPRIKDKRPVEGISYIKIRDLDISSNMNFRICNKDVITSKNVNIDIKQKRRSKAKIHESNFYPYSQIYGIPLFLLNIIKSII